MNIKQKTFTSKVRSLVHTYIRTCVLTIWTHLVYSLQQYFLFTSRYERETRENHLDFWVTPVNLTLKHVASLLNNAQKLLAVCAHLQVPLSISWPTTASEIPFWYPLTHAWNRPCMTLKWHKFIQIFQTAGNNESNKKVFWSQRIIF